MATLEDWQADCRRDLQVEHENDAFLKFVLLARRLGYTSVAYGLELPTSVAQPFFSLFANYATDWEEKFVEQRTHSPRVANGRRTGSASQVTPVQYWVRDDFLREASANDVTIDLSRRISGPCNSSAWIAMSGRTSSAGDEIIGMAEMLMRAINQRMTEILIPKNLPQHSIQLTCTEQKYLKWVLDGKKGDEIATIMEITPSETQKMQRKLPALFMKNGIFATAFFAFRCGMLVEHTADFKPI